MKSGGFKSAGKGRILRPLRAVATLLGVVVSIGTGGYWIIGRATGSNWPVFECLYMTVITLTTVGYGETIKLDDNLVGRVFTIGLLLAGCGIVLYCFSSFTAFLVEGHFGKLYWQSKMQRAMNKLQGHFIVCGAGETGIHVIEELIRTQRSFTVIEKDPARVEILQGMEDLLICEGDAENNDVLLAAGIERANALVTALRDDKDNIFVVISARQLNPRLRIIAKGILPDSTEKIRRAGADAVISPNFIGAMRMASEMIRPHVVNFLDTMLRDQRGVVRVEEVTLPDDSPLAGKEIRESNIHEATGLLVVGLRQAGAEAFDYNPGPDATLHAGSALVVLGEVPRIQALRKLAGLPIS